MFDVKFNVNLSHYTTFGIQASAAVLVEYDNPFDLPEILENDSVRGRTLFNLGSGSNVLFVEAFDGVVLNSRIGGIDVIENDGSSVVVRAGSGVEWDNFVEWAVENSFFGVENLSAIPGTVGASAVQNIGAYGAEAKDVIERVEVFDIHTRQQRTFSKQECGFGYRDSLFKHTGGRYVVTHVVYRLGLLQKFDLAYGALSKLKERPALSLRDVRDFIVEVRNSKLPDPKQVGSAGSFFKNPVVPLDCYEAILECYPEAPCYRSDLPDMVKLPAGWLIEHAGLKGSRCGGAEVWPKQCLVIANTGNATSSDVIVLKNRIQRQVKEEFNVDLEPEVLLVSADGSLIN